jgi:tripartite-type tricarboxylate transporter receptor subunit TctC
MRWRFASTGTAVAEGKIMQIQRRQFLHLAAGAAAFSGISSIVSAEAYPTRPVRIVVGFPPGGAADIVARLMGQWLSERLGQSFVIDNRPGATGNIATEAVVRAPRDGYTLLLATTPNAINATLYSKLNFDFMRDIAPIANVTRVPNAMVVNPSVSAETVPEFITYAKANPGKVNMASGGVGSTGHLSGELFKMRTGVNLVHVPYRGGAPALIDLIGGQAQVMFADPSSFEYIRVGRLRALAVTTARPSEALPDVPTIGEFIKDFEASQWYGVGAPSNTPAEIIDRLNREINAALSDPKIKARLADLGGTALANSPADFGKLIAEDTEKWGKVIRAANIKLE